MSRPTSSWPHASRRPLPPMHARQQVQLYLRKLFTDENLANLEKMLQADPRLVAFVREIAKKAAES